MNILYIAFSCNPFNGSEDQIGWNIPYYSSLSGNKVTVITTEDQKKYIEKYCKQNNFYNIDFHYIDMNKKLKKILTGQLFSLRLLIYNRKALILSRNICKLKEIEIIHQITPIEFRAIGKYYKIDNIKYVVGPVGGGSYTIRPLKKYVPHKKRLIELIRTIFNNLYSMKFKLLKTGNRIDCLICSNYETMKYLKTVDKKYIHIELGYDGKEPKKIYLNENSDILKILVPGRLVFIKGHRFLLDAVKLIPDNYKYQIIIVGDGEDFDYLNKRISKDDYLKKHIKMAGKVDFKKMEEQYLNCDIVLLPSIRENCCTTMLEALSYGKPVISLKITGMAMLNNESCGKFIEGNNNMELRKSLANNIIFYIENKNEIKKMKNYCINNAKKYTWDNNLKYYNEIYNLLIKERGVVL